MSGYISLALLVFTITYLTVGYILPAVNLHLTVDRQEILRQKVRDIVDGKRLTNRANPSALIENIDIEGLEILDGVTTELFENKSYLKVTVPYRLKKENLFNHSALDTEVTEPKVLEFYIDYVF